MINPYIASIIKNFIKQYHLNSKAIFWCGSTLQGEYTEGSDLDLVIVYEKIPNAYRETISFQGWQIDSFVHDPETINYFFEEIDKRKFNLYLASMIETAVEIPKAS